MKKDQSQTWRALPNTFGSPFRIAVGADANLLICADEQVWNVAPDGKASVFVSSDKIEEASDVAFDREQNLFIVDARNNSVRKVDPRGNVATFATGFDVPSGIAIDARGDVFVTEMYKGCIQKIDRAGSATMFATKLVRPCALAFGPDGTLFVAEEKRVRCVDAKGKVSHLHEKKFDVACIAVDGDGTVFASSHKVVRKIDRTGKITDIHGPTNRDADYVALALDHRGTLYVSDYANSLVYAVTL